MPHTRYPRIVGFEVPPLRLEVDSVRDAPIVALLDAAPADDWVAAFRHEATQAREPALAQASVEGDRVLFFASDEDGRRVALAIRHLVERVTERTREQRFAQAGLGATPSAPPMPSAQGRVLVVEDDDILREVTCGNVAEAGWVALSASNAPDALALLEGGAVVDAVFTDVDMPGGMDGLALATRVHQHWQSVGLVVTSGRYRDDAVRVPPGAVFLSKPCQRRQLLAVLALVCGATGPAE